MRQYYGFRTRLASVIGLLREQALHPAAGRRVREFPASRPPDAPPGPGYRLEAR
jgi:hypothetical protein